MGGGGMRSDRLRRGPRRAIRQRPAARRGKRTGDGGTLRRRRRGIAAREISRRQGDRHLAVGGRFVTIGRMSGVTRGELDVDRLAERRLHLYGVSNRLRSPAQRAESAKRFAADLLPAFGDGRLRPIIDRSFPLDEIAAAGAWLETDKHVGKVVIRIS